jgi:hypothetical protein
MAKKELTDPDEVGKLESVEEKEFETLDVSKIKVEVLPEDAAKASHPFDGYPIKKIKMDMKAKDKAGKDVMVPKEFNLTDWVLHNHIGDPVHQDPSNRRARTYHSRSIMDIRGGNSVPNVTMQFAKLIHTASGDFYGALVPDPYIRAQLIFKQEKKTGQVVVDKRYMLLDTEQKNRLKQCFLILIRPQAEMEKAADQITAGEEPTAMREVSPGEEL